MQIDIVTIFPEFFRGPLDYGIIRKAREAGLVKIDLRDLREHTRDRHRTVDDRPFGGGEGMWQVVGKLQQDSWRRAPSMSCSCRARMQALQVGN